MYKSSKKMTEFEKFQWAIFFIVLIGGFLFYFVLGWITNCVFEWPIRWDVTNCWNEQINPAKEKASEKAVNFIP